jgi:hypothetical protein
VAGQDHGAKGKYLILLNLKLHFKCGSSLGTFLGKGFAITPRRKWGNIEVEQNIEVNKLLSSLLSQVATFYS